eukprot:1485526-Pleurochrysis_carterae.AAC.1
MPRANSAVSRAYVFATLHARVRAPRAVKRVLALPRELQRWLRPRRVVFWWGVHLIKRSDGRADRFARRLLPHAHAPAVCGGGVSPVAASVATALQRRARQVGCTGRAEPQRRRRLRNLLRCRRWSRNCVGHAEWVIRTDADCGGHLCVWRGCSRPRGGGGGRPAARRGLRA